MEEESHRREGEYKRAECDEAYPPVYNPDFPHEVFRVSTLACFLSDLYDRRISLRELKSSKLGKSKPGRHRHRSAPLPPKRMSLFIMCRPQLTEFKTSSVSAVYSQKAPSASARWSRSVWLWIWKSSRLLVSSVSAASRKMVHVASASSTSTARWLDRSSSLMRLSATWHDKTSSEARQDLI